MLPMTSKYCIAREYTTPDIEHAFDTSSKMSTIKNFVLAGWPMPDEFHSDEIHWLVPEKTQKQTKGYLFTQNKIPHSNLQPTPFGQMLFFEITLTSKSKKKKTPYKEFMPFKKSEIDWHHEPSTQKTQAEWSGLLSQSGTPSQSFSVVLKSVAYGPSNYTQFNHSISLIYQKAKP